MPSKYHQTCGIIWLKEMIYTSEQEIKGLD